VNQTPYGIPKSNPFYGQENKRGEIWAWGLRNPWRFSFDRENGDIYYGDVGQNKWDVSSSTLYKIMMSSSIEASIEKSLTVGTSR
jgi:hypothetical protein